MLRLLALPLSIWLGAQLTLGYVVAPVLFAHLPTVTAGNIAGELFAILAWFGTAVWAIVSWVLHRAQNRSLVKNRLPALSLGLCALILASHALITPAINALKTGGQYWLLDWIGGSFAAWHGAASIVYLAVSIFGILLTIRLLRVHR